MRTLQRFTRAAVGLSVVLAGSLAPMAVAPTAAAPAPATWRPLGTSGQLNVSDLVSTARSTDGVLHVGWHRRTPNGLYDLMQTPVTARGAVGAPAPVVTGWASVEGPTLVTSGAAIFAFFSGTRTLVTGDPNEGVSYALTGDRGRTWEIAPKAAAAGDFAGQRDASVAIGPRGAIAAWYAGRETVVHVGVDPTVPNQRGYGSGTGQSVAVSNGAALVAWCTSVQGPNGVYVQRVDPVSGAPAGAARRVPGSTSAGSDGAAEAFCPASARVPLVARQGKGFFVATVDGSRRTVYGWPVGAARPLSLAGGPSFKQYVAAAASPGPKASVWVGWLDGSKVVLRRSNGAATVFGAPVSVTVPSDRSVYALDLNAQADRVDLITRVQRADGRISLEHAQSYPGLTLTATSGRQPTFRVLDAGDPVKSATVRVGGRSGVTNAAGQVRITGLKPGRFTARASAPQYVDAVVQVTVSR